MVWTWFGGEVRAIFVVLNSSFLGLPLFSRPRPHAFAPDTTYQKNV